jgi:glycosyltransferase involved in cell wall biosynthesis
LAWLDRRIQYAAALIVHKVDRFLLWLFATKNPAAVFVRESIRGNPLLLGAARNFLRFARNFPRWVVRWTKEKFMALSQQRLRSIMAARAIGGAMTLDELEKIWSSVKPGWRVLYIATGLEREQIEIVLADAHAKGICYVDLDADEVEALRAEHFEFIVAAAVPGLEPQLASLRRGLRGPEAFLEVGRASKRSAYFEVAATRGGPSALTMASPVQGDALGFARPLNVVFLNDVGFQYGAGIALKRQVASFLLNGSQVHVVAWDPGEAVAAPLITGIAQSSGWRGFVAINGGQCGQTVPEHRIVEQVVATIRDLAPDVIITGNLHGTPWPISLIHELKTIDATVIAYMHDCYWATGRCAYPVTCRLYEVGCNEACPTPEEYPRLEPSKIAAAWRSRADIFGGELGIPLVTNSAWTQELAHRRFGNAADIACVHLAVDHELFAPVTKAVARRLLGLPVDGTIIVMGAVDVLNKWKGGHLFRGIHAALLGRKDVSLVLFGDSSGLLKSTKSFGLIRDERMLPLIVNSADLFVGTATEEAFGQTLLEASACGVPVVAFDVGGVSDVVVNEETGLLVPELSVAALHAAIERLLSDRPLREAMGRNARRRVEDHFTLLAQSNAWMGYLASQPRPYGRVKVRSVGQ